MVGVGEAPAGDGLGLLPAQALLVDQDAHELGDRQAGMGVVHLEHHLFRQQVPVGAVDLFKVVQRVLHRGGGQEILLLEAQLLALLVVVLGIEHLGDDLHQLLALGGLDVLAPVELLHVDGLGGAGRPGAQHVDHVAVVAQHGDVVGHGLHGVEVAQAVSDLAVLVGIILDVAVEAHLHGLARAADLPHVAVLQPVVGQLHLVAVGDVLAEQAQLVADGAAHGEQLEGGERIEEAGGQAAEAAVAQAGLGLALIDAGLVDAQLVQRLDVFLLIHQGDHVVVHGAAHEELGGEVIELFRALALAFAPGGGPALHDLVAHGHGQGLVDLLVGGVAGVAAELALQFCDDCRFDLFFIHTVVSHSSCSFLI